MKTIVISSQHKLAPIHGLLLIMIIVITGCSLSNKDKLQCQEYPKSIGYVNDFEHVFSSNHLDS